MDRKINDDCLVVISSFLATDDFSRFMQTSKSVYIAIDTRLAWYFQYRSISRRTPKSLPTVNYRQRTAARKKRLLERRYDSFAQQRFRVDVTIARDNISSIAYELRTIEANMSRANLLVDHLRQKAAKKRKRLNDWLATKRDAEQQLWSGPISPEEHLANMFKNVLAKRSRSNATDHSFTQSSSKK